MINVLPNRFALPCLACECEWCEWWGQDKVGRRIRDFPKAAQENDTSQKNRLVMTSDQLCLIAIGGNMPSWAGPPERTVDAALQHLERAGAQAVAVSRLYRTPAFPAGSGPAHAGRAGGGAWGVARGRGGVRARACRALGAAHARSRSDWH